MSYQQMLGKFSITSSSKDLSIGGDAISLTTGDYYLYAYESEGVDQLCEHLQAKIRAIGATQDASTVVYSTSTQRVTITLETAATITFTDTALATILGFASSLGSATTHTATSAPRYVWSPTRSAWDYPTNMSAYAFWHSRSTSIFGRSKDGTTWGMQDNLIYDAVLTYRCLTESEVKIPTSGTGYSSLEQFFKDVVHTQKAGGIRFYPDRSYNSSSDVIAVVWAKDDGEEIGGWEEYMARHMSGYNGLWDVQIPLFKYVA